VLVSVTRNFYNYASLELTARIPIPIDNHLDNAIAGKMDENTDLLADKVQALGDLELAVLICLVADQHCIIEAGEQLMQDVAKELQLVRSLVQHVTTVLTV
jgi:hypothetical protein